MIEVELSTFVDADAVGITVTADTPEKAVELLQETRRRLDEAGIPHRLPEEDLEPWQR